MADRIEKLRKLAPTADELSEALPLSVIHQVVDRHSQLYPIVLSINWKGVTPDLVQVLQKQKVATSYPVDVGGPTRDHPALISVSQSLIEIFGQHHLSHLLTIVFCEKGTVIQRSWGYEACVVDQDDYNSGYEKNDYIVR